MRTEGPLVYWDHDIDRDATIPVSCNWCGRMVDALMHGPVYPDGWFVVNLEVMAKDHQLICPRCVAERLPE